jgi:hypothetical protein
MRSRSGATVAAMSSTTTRRLGWPGSRERDWLAVASQKLREFAEGLDLSDQQKKLLMMRWFEEANHYDELWRRQRLTYYALGVTTIVVSLSIPFLVAVSAPGWCVALAGVVVGVSTALEGFFRLGDRWRHLRRTAMLIHTEGIRFLELRKPYAQAGSHREAFPRFLETVERINETQSEDYVALLSEAASAEQVVEAQRSSRR